MQNPNMDSLLLEEGNPFNPLLDQENLEIMNVLSMDTPLGLYLRGKSFSLAQWSRQVNKFWANFGSYSKHGYFWPWYHD